jgi:hypothetical protein
VIGYSVIYSGMVLPLMMAARALQPIATASQRVHPLDINADIMAEF